MSDPNDAVPLPPMYRGVLAEDDVARVFDDLAACADIRSISVKQTARATATGGVPSLDEARALLVGGEARGVQVQYDYDGAAWRDTFLRRADASIEILRIRQDPPESG